MDAHTTSSSPELVDVAHASSVPLLMLLWAFANERFEADVDSPRAAVAPPPAPTSSDGEADYGTKNPAAAPG